MKLEDFTYCGPDCDDVSLLSSLPPALSQLLSGANGFIIDNGALHVRGICSDPRWHSLRNAWFGELAFSKLYDTIEPDDIPFAQDCVGDQFLLRSGRVLRLLAETGELEEAAVDLHDFFEKVESDCEEFLSTAPNHPLLPGQLLHACPPFVCEPSPEVGYSLRECAADEVIRYHADLAKQIAALPDGTSITFRLTD